MEGNSLSKHTVSFGLALAVASVFNALLVIVKEKSHAVQMVMQKLTGHHWVTHAAAVLLLFLACGWLLALPNHGKGLSLTANRLIGIVVAGLVAGGGIIMGFYLIAS